MIYNIKILETKVLSDNWYKLNKINYEYTKKDGRKLIQSREVYDRGNGSTILLYNKCKKTVILTRQFRLPTFVNGNETGMLIETCAGLLDSDNAEDCIRRETEEETGYKITEAQKIFEAYMSPGFALHKKWRLASIDIKLSSNCPNIVTIALATMIISHKGDVNVNVMAGRAT